MNTIGVPILTLLKRGLQDLTNSGLHQIILSDDLLMKKSAAPKGEI